MAWWKRKQTAAPVDMAPKPDGAGVESAPTDGTAGAKPKMRMPRWRWRSSGKQEKPEPAPEASEDTQPNGLLAHDDFLLAFGLNWEMLQKGQKQKLLTQSLAQGYTHHVVGVESDQIGFLKWPQRQRDKRAIYSGALLLSETLSLGGDEVFAFRLDEARYALVALKNSMPVPGFDRVGAKDEMAKVALDYLSLPHKNEVRRCGDAEILSGAETLDISAPLLALDKGLPLLKPIPDMRRLLLQVAGLAAVLLVITVAWWGWTYFQAKEEAERLQRENDPNMLYERHFANASASINGLGTAGLQAMVATLTRLPLDLAGWALTHVACQPSECVATWSRHAGNFSDFDENLPPDVVQKPEYGFMGADSKGVQLKTRHPVTMPETAKSLGLKREALPTLAMVQSDFVSRLQDYTLIEARAQVMPPKPFPAGVSNIAPIFRPVVSGSWSMELPLWSIESIALPEYVKVESLTLELGSAGASQAGPSNAAKHYKLTGKYYAKGKVF